MLELDGDGHLDLLLGDVSYANLIACYMADAVDGQDSTTATNGSWPADLGGEAVSVERFRPPTRSTWTRTAFATC